MTGYELRFQMGVTADRVMEAFPLPSTIVDAVPPAPGGVEGTGTAGFALSPNFNLGVKAINRLLKAGAKISAGDDHAMIVTGVARDVVQQHGKELGVMFRALDALPANARSTARAAHRPLQELARQHGRRLDALAAGAVRVHVQEPVERRHPRRPVAVRRDPVCRRDRRRDPERARARNDAGPVCGRDRVDGAANLRKFVERGGWVVAWDHAADFAIMALGLPLRNTVKTTRPSEFFIPGSLIKLEVEPAHPLAAGVAMKPDNHAIAMFADSQAFTIVPPAAEGKRARQRHVDGTCAIRAQRMRCSSAAGSSAPRASSRPRRRRARAGGQGSAVVDRLPSALARPAAQHVQTAVQSAVRIDEFKFCSLIDPMGRESACR